MNTNHPHILRANGTIELPFGPGKPLFAGSSGFIARAIEQWKVGYIYTLSSGAWSSISAQSNLYANGVPDVADPALLKELLADTGLRWTQKAGSLVQGNFFDPTKWTKVPDPQCSNVTNLQNLNGLNPGTSNRCNLTALARIVSGGTPGSIPLTDGSGNAGLIVLQNPQPGTQGNLGQNVLRGLAPWRFDLNLSKSFRVTEDMKVQFRADAVNVLNHPQAERTESVDQYPNNSLGLDHVEDRHAHLPGAVAPGLLKILRRPPSKGALVSPFPAFPVLGEGRFFCYPERVR